MTIYENRQEVLDKLEQNLQVTYKSYGTWLISSCLDSVELYYISHNEEDSIGIFDGETYNKQDFEDWKEDFAQYEIENYENYHDEELIELFNGWCEILWTDSANESNYEPREKRFHRLAENLLAYQGEDNLIFTNNGQVVILTNEEYKFIEECGTYYLKLILDCQYSEFIKAFNEWANNE